MEKQNPVARKDGMSSVGKLRLVATYSPKNHPPMCEAEGCVQRACGYYGDQSGLGFDLCVDHIRLHVSPEEVSA